MRPVRRDECLDGQVGEGQEARRQGRVSDAVQSCSPLSTPPAVQAASSLAPRPQSTYTHNPPPSPCWQALQDPKKIATLPKLAVGRVLECTRCSGGAATAFFFALGSVAAHAHVSGYSMMPIRGRGPRFAFRHPGLRLRTNTPSHSPRCPGPRPMQCRNTYIQHSSFPSFFYPPCPSPKFPIPREHFLSIEHLCSLQPTSSPTGQN